MVPLRPVQGEKGEKVVDRRAEMAKPDHWTECFAESNADAEKRGLRMTEWCCAEA